MAEPKKLLRVMADTNILVAGILFPRWFHEFLRHALKGDFQHCWAKVSDRAFHCWEGSGRLATASGR